MGYRLHWNHGGYDGWEDHLPEYFFAENHKHATHSHRCKKKGQASLVASCEITSHNEFIEIYYTAGQKWIDSGTTCIQTRDHAPNLKATVLWAEPGFDFRPISPAARVYLAPDDEEELLESRAYRKVRCSQDLFRQGLEQRWSHACALTGISTRHVLRASHMKAWREKDGRLAPDNGLLLAAHVDALFDKSLLTFDYEGRVHWSPEIGDSDREVLNLPRALRDGLSDGEKRYLTHHQKQCAWFDPTSNHS